MAQKKVIVKGAIFPTIKIRSNNLMCVKVWGRKRRQFQLLDLPHTCCLIKDVSLEI